MGKRRTRLVPEFHNLVTTSSTENQPRMQRQQSTKQKRTRTKKSAYAYSALLFAEPTFLRGVARLLDFGGNLSDVNIGLTLTETDMLALAADRWAVFQDYRAAHAQVRQMLLEELEDATTP